MFATEFLGVVAGAKPRYVYDVNFYAVLKARRKDKWQIGQMVIPLM